MSILHLALQRVASKIGMNGDCCQMDNICQIIFRKVYIEAKIVFVPSWKREYIVGD
ncbi:MAG: hypothetical protein WBN94_12480 [Methanothrix sp.]